MQRILHRYPLSFVVGCLLAGTIGLAPPLRAQQYALATTTEPLRQDVKDQTSLGQALQKLETEYTVRFLYDLDLVDDLRVPESATKGNNLEETLQALLAPLSLQYKKIRPDYYVIKSQNQGVPKVPVNAPKRLNQLLPPTPLLSKQWTSNISQRAIEKTITGQVTDLSTSETLPGVNVLVKGTTVGTVTDVEGNYRLTAPDDAEMLVFSSVGYAGEEVAIGNRTIINLALAPDIQSLSEVVVVGYGTQKQSQITGAVSTVSSEDIQSVAAPNFEQSLQGRTTGLNLVAGSGQPDAPIRIQIRGTNSATTSTEPLIIVDGVQLNGGTSALNFINPSDIASVSVLKDASATAIYGSRGANGVILVTTKTGKQGEGKITFGYTRGITSPINMVELADADQFRQLLSEARVNSGLEGTVPPQDLQRLLRNQNFEGAAYANSNLYNTTSTDWVDLMIGDGSFDQYDISLSQGSEKSSFFVSGQYRTQEGNYRGEQFDRFNFRSNLTFSPKDFINFGIRYNVSFIDNDRPVDPRRLPNFVSLSDATQNWGGSGGYPKLYGNALPVFPVYWPTGTTFPFGNPNEQYPFDPTSGNNVLYSAQNTHNQERTIENLANIFVEVEPLTDLTLRAELSGRYTTNFTSRWNGENIRPIGEPDPTVSQLPDTLAYVWEGSNRFEILNSRALNYNTNVTANYARDFGDHNFGLLLGYEAIKIDPVWAQTNVTQGAASTNEPEVPGANTNQGPNLLNAQYNINDEERFVSQFGRFNYDYQDRYLLQLTLRRDGSSKFAPANRFAYFPSVSAGWVITEEDFMPEGLSNVLSFAKLRASWGKSGNAGIGNFLFLPGSFFNWPPYGYGSYASGSLIQSEIGTDDIRWETSTTIDLGLDFDLFNGRLGGTVAYYRTQTNDLLFATPLPASLGIYAGVGDPGSATQNIGQMRNQGIELSLNSVNLRVGNFEWTTTLNLTTNRNEVVSIYEGFGTDPNSLTPYSEVSVFPGEALGTYYLPEFAGYDDQGQMLVYELDQELKAEGITQRTGERIVIEGGQVNEHSVLQSGKTGNPTFFGGFGNTFSYRGFSLQVFFSFQGGNYLYDDNLSLVRAGNGSTVLREDLVGNYWTPQNTDAKYPAIYWQNQAPVEEGERAIVASTTNDHWLQRGDYARLRTISLEYLLPNSILERTPLQSARVFITLNNVATFTNYDAYDPEYLNLGLGNDRNTPSSALRRNVGQGVINSVPFPQVFTTSFGINLGF